MSKQEIIDTIEIGFEGKAEDERGGCLYLTLCGLKRCAIGLFIPDGHDAQASWNGVAGVIDSHPDILEHMPSRNMDFLSRFQERHDKLNSLDSIADQKSDLTSWVNENYDNYEHKG